MTLFLVTVAASGADSSRSLPAQSGPEPTKVGKPTAAQQLDSLVNALAAARADLKELRGKAPATRDETEKKRLEVDIESLNKNVDELLASLEKIATGGATAALAEEQEVTTFDWQREIEDLFRPLLYELKRLTERPRRIEQLRTQQSLLEGRLASADAALENIIRLKADTQTPASQKELETIEQRWHKRRDELNNKLTGTILELDELLAPPEEENGANAWETTRQIFSGRVLNLILAVAAFLVTYLLLRQINLFYQRRASRRMREPQNFSVRMVNLLFITLSVLLALLAAMVVLSVRGDWMLLGLVIIALLASALALRHSLPRYLREARTLLNIGTVREGERVVYQGLPWKVATLDVYSTLVNPALRGGRLRLSLNEIATLHSRQYDAQEGWFPTREEDYVLLDDSTFGRVLQQTPEYVQLAVAGSVKTYSVSSFLGANPRNLSTDGFGMFVTLGLDYRYQPEITTAIRDQVEAFIRRELEAHPVGEHLKNVIVEFNEAGASSLDIAIIGVFTGGAAADYFGVKRLLNRLAVDVCNAHNWVMPFNQISVHMETSGQPGSPAGAPPPAPA
jgi:hypothetical protein